MRKIIFVLILILFSLQACEAGVSSIDPLVNEDAYNASDKFLVTSVGVPNTVTITPSKNIIDYVEIKPNEFNLTSGSNKMVTITATSQEPINKEGYITLRHTPHSTSGSSTGIDEFKTTIVIKLGSQVSTTLNDKSEDKDEQSGSSSGGGGGGGFPSYTQTPIPTPEITSTTPLETPTPTPSPSPTPTKSESTPVPVLNPTSTPTPHEEESKIPEWIFFLIGIAIVAIIVIFWYFKP